MKLPIGIFSLALLVFAGLSLTQTSRAQQTPTTSPEPDLEATLHIIVGSDGSQPGGGLPQSLTSISRQLAATFPFTSYRVAGTHMSRFAINGHVEARGTTDMGAGSTETESPNFLEWLLLGARRAEDLGRQGYFVDSFRFGIRIPIRSMITDGDSGRTRTVTAYEQLALNLNRIRIPENKPTLVGTLSMPASKGTIFIVLTVKRVAE